jgi:hypothetical protein
MSKHSARVRRAVEQQQTDQQDLKKWRRRYTMGIVRSVVMLVALIVLTVLLALRSNRPEVLNVMPATALDDEMRPVERTSTYPPDADAFFVSVELRGYAPDMPLAARWLHEGRLLIETPLSTDMTGEGFAGFVLRTDDPPWPVGGYEVEIVFRDSVLGSASFEVAGE